MHCIKLVSSFIHVACPKHINSRALSSQKVWNSNSAWRKAVVLRPNGIELKKFIKTTNERFPQIVILSYFIDIKISIGASLDKLQPIKHRYGDMDMAIGDTVISKK
jgi:hypothetical protein